MCFLSGILRISSIFNLNSTVVLLSLSVNGQNEKQNVLFVEAVSDESEVEDADSCFEEDEELQTNDQSSIAVDSLSLEEKVARFIQLGELDESEGEL